MDESEKIILESLNSIQVMRRRTEQIYHFMQRTIKAKPLTNSTSFGVDVAYTSAGASSVESITLFSNFRINTLAQLVSISVNLQYELAAAFFLVQNAAIQFITTPGNPLVRQSSFSATMGGANTANYSNPEFAFTPSNSLLDLTNSNIWFNSSMNPTINLVVYGNFTAAIAVNGYVSFNFVEYPAF